MKKVLSFTLASLALAALAAPVYAGQFGGSIRGDVGPTGSQVPFFGVQTGLGLSPSIINDGITNYSNRKDGQWDFTGRLFWYTSCSPCSTYIAGSWQGSKHTVDTDVHHIQSAVSQAVIPVRTSLLSSEQYVIPAVDSAVSAKVSVENEFSKAKLGFGFDLIKTNCFAFTMEVGGNYLDAKLNTHKTYGIGATEEGTALTVPGGFINSGPLPVDYVIHVDESEKTEGAGIYAMFKGEYKFPATCLGTCFSIYGKAEVADIIGRQNYDYNYNYVNEFGTAQEAPQVNYSYQEHPERRYTNVVEVDLEAALVYSPCFKCWDNLNMNFALGVRTDSFVNVFAHPAGNVSQSIMSLARPTVFLEVGIKI